MSCERSKVEREMSSLKSKVEILGWLVDRWRLQMEVALPRIPSSLRTSLKSRPGSSKLIPYVDFDIFARRRLIGASRNRPHSTRHTPKLAVSKKKKNGRKQYDWEPFEMVDLLRCERRESRLVTRKPSAFPTSLASGY